MSIEARVQQLEKRTPSLATKFVWRHEYETADEAIAREALAGRVSPSTLAARANLVVIGWQERSDA